MARFPAWFEQLDTIVETIRRSSPLLNLGRREIQEVFACSQRDSIRLLHRFGAALQDDVLSIPQPLLIAALEQVEQSHAYRTFRQRRDNVAGNLNAARRQAVARRLLVPAPQPVAQSFGELPETLHWRRSPGSAGKASFEIRYRDGTDLLTQLAAFLAVASANREEFFESTEPA